MLGWVLLLLPTFLSWDASRWGVWCVLCGVGYVFSDRLLGVYVVFWAGGGNGLTIIFLYVVG